MRLFFIFLLTLSVHARTWTNFVGTQFEGVMTNTDGKEVTLKLKSGQSISLEVAKLSKEDQQYLRRNHSRAGVGEEKWTNWDQKYPFNVTVSNQAYSVESVENAKPGFYYETTHFSFKSQVQLSTILVRKLAWYFETTHAYMEQLPLSFARTQEVEKHKILLVETAEDYYRNGGPLGSAGVYIPSSDLVMVPLSSLGVKKVGNRYTIDLADQSNRTLSHEIVHALTDQAYFKAGALGWFTEGLAELVSVTPYKNGNYASFNAVNNVKQYVTYFDESSNRGRNLGSEIKVGSLERFFKMSYGQFAANGNFNYGVGALVVTYFLDLRRDQELKNIQKFLLALKEGKSGESALKELLNGRTYPDLENSIKIAWQGKGVKLKFK